MKKVLSLMLIIAIVLTMASFPAFAASQVVTGTIPWGDDYMQANSWNYGSWLDNNEETGDGTYHGWSDSVATAPFVDGEGNPLGNYFELDLGAEYDVESVVIKWGNYNAGWGMTSPIAYSISFAGEDKVYGEVTSYTDLHQKYVDDALPANLVASTNVDYKDTALLNIDATETNVGTIRYVKVELASYQWKAYIRDIVVTVDDGAGSEPETPDLSEAITLNGATIRLASARYSAGLRFGATLSKEAIGIEGRTWYPGIERTEIGMYLLPTEMLGEDETLADYLENGGTEALKIVAKAAYAQNSATITYTAVLTGIPEDSYDWEVAAVPYILVDGEYTYYEEANKSYAQVAQAAIDSYNNGNPNNITPNQLTSLQEIVDIADSYKEPDPTPDPEEPTPDEPTPDEPTYTEEKVVLTTDNIVSLNRIWDSGYVNEANFSDTTLFFDGDDTTYACWDQYKDDGTTADCCVELVLDLGAVKKLSKIRVFTGAEHFGGDWWSDAAPMNAEILIAGEDGVYTSVYTYDSDAAEATREDLVVFDTVEEARFVKYTFNKVARRASIGEIEVYEMVSSEGGDEPEEPTPEEPTPDEPTPDEPETPALTEQQVVLTADNIVVERNFVNTGWVGEDSDLTPNKAILVDGAVGTYAAINVWGNPTDLLDNGDASHYYQITVDLGTAKNLTKINFHVGAENYGNWWQYAAPLNAEILVAGEDGVYRSLYTYNKEEGDDAYRLDAVTLDYLTSGAGIRYIKYTFSRVYANATLAEIEVFEMAQSGDAGEEPAPSLIYYDIDAAASAQGLNYDGAVLPASLFVDLGTTYAGYEINGSYKVDAETLKMLTTVSCIGDGEIAYKDYREFASYIETVDASWGQNDNEGYGEDNYGAQIKSAPISKLSDPVYMSMVLASEAPTYQNKDDKPEEHQNNGVNMHAPSTDTVFNRLNALGAIYVNKDLKSELKSKYKNEQVTVCIGNINLLIRTADGWIERTVAAPTAGFGMLYALPWQLEWELGSDVYGEQLCINVDNSMTQYANYTAIKMDVADFLENKRGNWWGGGTSFDERTFHFWGGVYTLEELGISVDTEVLGVIASFDVWVEEEELAPYFVASVGADWRLESGATRQAFAGHQITTTTDKQVLFGHSFGAEAYETYVAPELDNVKAMLGIQ